jgi:hypothetical protein
MVERRGPGIQPNLSSENQLCVPLMNIKGESFRLKEKRRAGLIDKLAGPDGGSNSPNGTPRS